MSRRARCINCAAVQAATFPIMSKNFHLAAYFSGMPETRNASSSLGVAVSVGTMRTKRPTQFPVALVDVPVLFSSLTELDRARPTACRSCQTHTCRRPESTMHIAVTAGVHGARLRPPAPIWKMRPASFLPIWVLRPWSITGSIN